MVYAVFSYILNARFIILLNLGSIKVDCYTFINPLRHAFKLYTKVWKESSVSRLANTTTTLLNAVMYSHTNPHYYIYFSLSPAMFL